MTAIPDDEVSAAAGTFADEVEQLCDREQALCEREVLLDVREILLDVREALMDEQELLLDVTEILLTAYEWLIGRDEQADQPRLRCGDADHRGDRRPEAWRASRCVVADRDAEPPIAEPFQPLAAS